MPKIGDVVVNPSVVTKSDGISVVVVEDDQRTRERLERIFAESTQFILLGSAGSLGTARTLVNDQCPDVLLTDLELPDGNGVVLIRELLHSEVKILVLSVFGDEKSVVDAISAGASGYFLKDSSVADISQAVCDLYDGGVPISPGIARYLLKHFKPPKPIANTPADEFTLSHREHEVLNLVAKGYTYAEIAGVLSLSTHTVSSHVKNIYKKLKVNSRGEAVFEATQLGIIH